MLIDFPATVLASVTTAINFALLVLRNTRKGIFFINYVYTHAAQILFKNNEKDCNNKTLKTDLFGWSVFCLLLEHSYSLNKREKQLKTAGDVLTTLAMVGGIHFTAITFHYHAFHIGRVLCMFGIVYNVVYLYTYPRNLRGVAKIEEWLQRDEKSFFYDPLRPLNCLGREGWLQVVVVLSKMSLGLLPDNFSQILSSLLSVADNFTILSILTMPVMTGGMVQTLKVTANWFINSS